MNHRPTYSILALLLCSICLLSCAGGSSINQNQPPPVVPDLTGGTAGPSQGRSGSAGHYLWGYYTVLMDPVEMKFELITMRQVAGHWNVLKWLEQGPCTNCLQITSFTNSDHGTKLIDVKIKHPFALANLTGFDVRGIAMFMGSHTFPLSGLSTSDRNIGDGELINPDGYTSLYNWTTSGGGPGGLQGYIKGKFATATVPDSLINGYKRYISDDPSNIRNAFLAGDVITETYDIDMPTGTFVMGYAVDASWVKASVTPVTDPMLQFPLEANCPEPWKIDVLVEPVGAGFSHLGGSEKLTITVYDRQGKDTHKEPVIECADLFDGAVTATWKSSSPGMSVWEATLENVKEANDGIFKCLVSVEANENDSSPYYLDLTAYDIVNFDIPPARDPIALAAVDPVAQKLHQDIHFQDAGSYDPDGGAITDYDWDVTSDSIADFSGADVYRRFGVPGIYHANLVVKDDQGATGALDPKIDFEIIDSGYGISDENASGEIKPMDIAIDSNGYLYFCGYFSGSNVDFDPGYGEDLHSSNGEGDSFLLCFNSFGNHQWTRTWGGTEPDVATSVCVDGIGFVYVGGWFWNTVDFDPGPAVDSGTAEDMQDAYLVKYDAPGNYQWHRNWGGSHSEEVLGVSAIPDYVVASGYFNYSCDFDPGSGIDNYDAWANDGYLSIFDNDGTYKQVVVIGQAYNDDAQACAISPTNNVYVAGMIGNNISGWDFDGYLNRYDLAGNLTWSKRWTGTNWNNVLDIAIDTLDNTYLCGQFRGTCDFDPGTGEDNRDADGNDAYISAFNFNGDHQWTAVITGSSEFETAYGIAVGADGGIFTCGGFSDTVDLDSGSGVGQYTSNGSLDFFLTKYTSDGTYVWGRAWGGSGFDNVQTVAVQNNGNSFSVGSFCAMVDFDPGIDVCERTSITGSDMFLLKCFSNGYWE